MSFFLLFGSDMHLTSLYVILSMLFSLSYSLYLILSILFSLCYSLYVILSMLREPSILESTTYSWL